MRIFLILKRNLISILFVLFALFLVLFSNSNLTACKDGLLLWANSVIPSLFPFLVAAQLLGYTNVVDFLSMRLNFLMKPLFNVPGSGAFPFIMGLISGYPVGAKIVSDLYVRGEVTKGEAERLLCFTNNSGPLFIISTVGSSLYGSTTIGAILLFTHILASLAVGIILGVLSRKKSSGKSITGDNSVTLKVNSNLYPSNYNKSNNTAVKSVRISNLGEILGDSILSGIKTILMIGGFVTLFSVIISILKRTKILIIFASIIANILHINQDLVLGLFTGIIEFTNGLSIISNIHLKNISVNLVLSSFLLGFGGISVTLQVLSIISKNKLSGRKYLFGKILHGLLAAIITWVVLQIPLFNFNL